jgi:hypothetical protein
MHALMVSLMEEHERKLARNNSGARTRPRDAAPRRPPAPRPSPARRASAALARALAFFG